MLEFFVSFGCWQCHVAFLLYCANTENILLT
ncbi:hypothetical protein LTSEMON_6432, partial [Salmonella enterica subsp. enterica serovar Montevideo str. S5-403]